MRFPDAFCISLGEQLTAHMRRKASGRGPTEAAASACSERERCFKTALKTYENPVNVHGVIIPYDPDTGSTATFLTEKTLDYIIQHAQTPVEVVRVKPYDTELANG